MMKYKKVVLQIISVLFFMMDFLFCFIVAWYFYDLRDRTNQKETL